MKGKIVGIIIISILLVISCTCSIIGTVKHFKNDNNNLSDNKEINKTKEDNKNNVESKEESKISEGELETEEEYESEEEEEILSYVEPKTIIKDALPVFNNYKIIKANDANFEKVIKENGLKVCTDCSDDDFEFTVLIDKNYKEKKGVAYPNNLAFYDSINEKIYVGYAFIDNIDDNTIYLGNYNPGDYTAKDYSYDDGSVRIDVLQIDEDKIITVDLKAPVYGDNLDSHEYYAYFRTAGNYMIYSNKLLLDSKLNVIQNKFDDYCINENNQLIIKKKNKITIYENNLELLKEKEIENIEMLSEEYILLNDNSSLKLLSYDDIINDENNVINTGIKLGKKQKIYYIEVEEKISIIIEDESKSEKEIEKICEGNYGDTSYGIKYSYDIDSKKLSKKNICINEV